MEEDRGERAEWQMGTEDIGWRSGRRLGRDRTTQRTGCIDHDGRRGPAQHSRQVTIEHMSDCARGHPEAFQVRSHGAIVRWVLYNWKPNGKHD